MTRSLKALKVDSVEIAELPINASAFPQIMGPNGAYIAFQKAKQEGIIDFIGVTSHDVDFLNEAISTKAFSNLITPFNYVANTARTKFLSLAEELNIGFIAMKTLGKGGLPHVPQALRYVWSHNIHTAIVGMNKLYEVEENVSTANNFQPLTTEEEKSTSEDS